MSRRGTLKLVVFLLALASLGYISGSLRNHNHSSTSGQGGTLSNLSVTGTLSNTTNQVVGGYENVRGTATVDGNAFSVGGSTFVVSGGSVSVGGSFFLNGTAQSTSYVVSSSSQITTFGSLASITTAMGRCVDGSTAAVTVRGGGGDVLLDFYGSMTGNAGSVYRVGFIRDGNFCCGLSSAVGMDNNDGQPLAAGVRYHFHHLIKDETAGLHSYCLVVASDGAATTVSFPSAVANQQARWTVRAVP